MSSVIRLLEIRAGDLPIETQFANHESQIDKAKKQGCIKIKGELDVEIDQVLAVFVK